MLSLAARMVLCRNRGNRGPSEYAIYTSLALLLPVSTVVGYLIGSWLDGRLGTTWLRFLFLVLGSAGGFIQLIRQIMRDSSDNAGK